MQNVKLLRTENPHRHVRNFLSALPLKGLTRISYTSYFLRHSKRMWWARIILYTHERSQTRLMLVRNSSVSIRTILISQSHSETWSWTSEKKRRGLMATLLDGGRSMLIWWIDIQKHTKWDYLLGISNLRIGNTYSSCHLNTSLTKESRFAVRGRIR